MKLTFNPTTKVQYVVLDDDRIIQNSSGNKVYLYGIPGGWEIKATFTRRDNVQIGLIGGTYDLDPNDEYCYIIPIPSKATEVDKGLGLSILIYEPSGTTYIRHSTIATSMYVYSSNNVIIPDDLDTVLYDALNLAISNLATNKYEYDAIVGGTGETLSKDTPVYSKAKIDELDVVIVSNINTHKGRTDNPHAVTKNQVGLGNADNTSDVDKPVSTDQQAALDLKENLSNKRTSWNSTPSNTSYPSEKLTKDSLDLKVDKATTLLGLDLANDIARAEFVAALGNATALLSGLLSPEDYSLLVTLRAMLGEEADVDTFVNTFNEILAIFSNYPEGADLVTVLAGKVDKVSGKELSSNDYTDAEQAKVSHLPDNIITFMGDYYTKAQVDVLLDQLTTAYGLTETAITELAHNGMVLLSSLTDYDYITMYLKHSDTHFIFDAKMIDPAMFVNDGDMIQLNAWDGLIQQSYGVLSVFYSFLKFAASDESDTLVIKGYKKEAISSDLVGTEHSGTNYLDETGSVKVALEELDSQIKINETSIGGLDVRIVKLETSPAVDLYTEYGVREIVGQSSATLERVKKIGSGVLIGAATGLVAAAGIDAGTVTNSFDSIPIFQRQRVTNPDGNVFVKVSKYYIKEEWVLDGATNYHYIWMCQSKLPGYRTPISFMNEDGSENDCYFIGAYEASLGGDGKLKSISNAVCKVSYSRANFRTAARLNDGLGVASKYQITDVAEYVDLVQIPMMIEFATKNLQSVLTGFTSGSYTSTHLPLLAEVGVNRVILTNTQAALYRVGQCIDIGTSQGGRQVAQDRVIVSITVDTPEVGQTEIVFDGSVVTTTLTQMIYNVSYKTGQCDAVVASSGSKTANDGKNAIIWRGIENPYGNNFKNIDGVKISNNQTWVCLYPSKYDDAASVAGDYAAPFIKLSYLNINTNGYCVELGYDLLYPFAKFPTSITDGSSALYFSDYYYQNTGDRTCFVGGYWYDGSFAGPFYWHLGDGLGVTGLVVGARLSKRP